MKSLSQSEYGELRSLYQQVYVSTDEITVDDLSEEVVEEIFDELVQEYVSEGYEIEEVLDVVEDAALDFIEAKVTYGHDTEAPKAPEKKSMLKGRIRYAKRKAGEAVKRAGEKAQGAKAMAGIAGSIAKDEVKRAGRAGKQAVVGAAQKKKEQVKKGVKGLIGRGLRKAAGAVGKVASKAAGAAAKLGEEAVGEGIDFKGAAREQARRDAIQAEKDKKSPSSKQRRLALGKFRPGASAEERAEGGRDAMREKGTSPTKNGKKMFEELQATGLFTDKEIDAILEASEDLDEATAMAKRGYDEAPIRQKIAKSTGGGKAADRATKLADRPTFGDAKKAKQRQDLARKQRGDFRKTTSSSPGLHGYGHKSDDPKVKEKQAARGAQRGAPTPDEKKSLGR